jgi:hypothetical protein
MSGKRRHGRQAELPRVVLDTGALIALDEQRPVVVVGSRDGSVYCFR